MDHITFSNNPTHKILLLIKAEQLNKEFIRDYYLKLCNIPIEDITAISLPYDAAKPTAAFIQSYIDKILKITDTLKSEYIFCCDEHYFKILTRITKITNHIGYVLKCVYSRYSHINVIYCPNYEKVTYDPVQQDWLIRSVQTLSDRVNGQYRAPGLDIIHSETYPESLSDVQRELSKLHEYETLTCDIEAFSLDFYRAGIGTIGFSWDEHNGVVFTCDADGTSLNGMHCYRARNNILRDLLKKFFIEYKGKLIFHNMTYDACVLVYELFMESLNDYEGMIQGIDILCKDFEDTKILSYLATNNCIQNRLSLKDQAHEFAGNYAVEDIEDIRYIPKPDLLRYNLIDCLSTFHLFNKHYPTIVNNRLDEVYTQIYKPAIKQIIQMQLVGMPIDRDKVVDTENQLRKIDNALYNDLVNLPVIEDFTKYIRMQQVLSDNQKLKTKKRTLEDEMIQKLIFNPNSNKQLKALFYEYLKLPIIELTAKGYPSTSSDTIIKLLDSTQDETAKKLLTLLVELNKVKKIISTFIPVLQGSIQVAPDDYRLFGNFNLGQVKSSRLSSSKPNLQQLPSGSTYGKLIKQCFKAPGNLLFCGADYSALEDVANALVTKDLNKLKPMSQGIDSHSWNTYHYWPHKFEDIRLAKDEERCFAIIENGSTILCKSGDFVMDSNGVKKPIEDYYDETYK
jgi:DNA polymerase-1